VVPWYRGYFFAQSWPNFTTPPLQGDEDDLRKLGSGFLSPRKWVAGMFNLFGAAKAVASHRTPRLHRARLEHFPVAHRLNDENEILKDPHDPTQNGKPRLKIAIDRRASRKAASCCRFAHG
jgi:hypothetical protein